MNVPQLRFSGFDGEWEVKRIKDIAPLQRGFDLVKENIVPGKYPIGYSNGILGYHNEYKAKGPGVFTGRSGTIGNIHYTESDYWPHNTSLWVTDFKNNNEKFIYYFYKKVDLKKYNAGSTVPTLNRNDVHDLKRAIPKRVEQEKIAIFLTLLEKRIEKQQEKIEKLEHFKKGVMQKVFSQEMRFKDERGGDFPAWEEKQLGQVLKIKHGRDQKKIETINGKFPILATGGIIGKTNTFLYDKESVLIGRKGTIDRPVYMDTPFWTVDTLFYSEIKENNYAKFIFYIFQNINWKLYNEASGVPSLSAKTIEAIKITAPTFREQKGIADYLSEIDRKIEKEKEKLVVLEEQKRGFMQRMFV